MIVSSTITVQSKGFTDVLDITGSVQQIVAQSGIRDGSAIVFVKGSTAGVSTIEFEPGLVADLKQAFERIAPSNVPYQHDRRWGDGNGFSHIRATLMGPSLSVPLVGGVLALGTWQQIVLVDFDNRPRRREILVQVTGE